MLLGAPLQDEVGVELTRLHTGGTCGGPKKDTYDSSAAPARTMWLIGRFGGFGPSLDGHGVFELSWHSVGRAPFVLSRSQTRTCPNGPPRAPVAAGKPPPEPTMMPCHHVDNSNIPYSWLICCNCR